MPMSSTERHIPILYKDDFLCIVNKPAGIPSQPDPTGDVSIQELLQRQLELQWIGLVHRLDRPVSGAMLFALDHETLQLLNDLFRKREVKKTYRAIVEGRPEWRSTKLETWLKHDQKSRKARNTGSGEGEKAELNVTVLAQGDRYSLVEIVPHGGLFHQIRAQLAEAGHPIKGDVKYGARRSERGEGARWIGLHAHSLSFHHPATDKFIEAIAIDRTDGIWPVMLAKIN
jgi:23S rRNA pseudouridine1911/1915/1917 synthase